MARKAGGVNIEALGLLLTDAVMRALVPALDERIREGSAAAVAASVAPLLEQLAALERSVTEARAVLHNAASVELLEHRVRAAIETCEGVSDRAIERAVEQVQPFKYRGPWEAASAYELNHSVTQRGSMWIARQAVPAGVVPGSDAGAEFWTLAVKCGRDAKGA